MKTYYSLFILTNSLIFAQQLPVLPPPQALPLITQYLSLTATQVQSIVQNNSAFNQFASTKQTRIFQVQNEITQVTQASPIDPMALGVRYGEIEEICRELRTNAAQAQQQNIAVLTDAQKVKLQALSDAMKLIPVIAEGQSDNILPVSGTPTFFNTNFSSFLAGGILGSVAPGCSISSAPALVVRTGDFSTVPPPVFTPGPVPVTPNQWFNPSAIGAARQ